MANIGYTLMGEQRAPKDLVNDAVRAEQAGFDFAVISDHFHPWVDAQGHAPYTWSVLGAVAQATSRLPLMTYVTTPTIRYHPAIVAQKAATMAILSDGRFRLGLGAGEELNEHVVGEGFPPAGVRHSMLAEAVEIIRELWGGKFVTYHGQHYDVEDARIFDLPATLPEIGIAASGPESCHLAGEMADYMISTLPQANLVKMFQAAGGEGKPIVGQLSVCWGQDVNACRTLAREQFGWSVGGWKIQSELPNTANFEAFVKVIDEAQVTKMIPCGPDLDQIAQGVKKFLDAGFTDVALVQIGQAQEEFCSLFQRELGAKLKAL